LVFWSDHDFVNKGEFPVVQIKQQLVHYPARIQIYEYTFRPMFPPIVTTGRTGFFQAIPSASGIGTGSGLRYRRGGIFPGDAVAGADACGRSVETIGCNSRAKWRMRPAACSKPRSARDKRFAQTPGQRIGLVAAAAK
jgi:hypothetical protein